MIVVDTSAILAILKNEELAEACLKVVENADGLLISTGTMVELMIVAGSRGCADRLERYMARLDFEVRAVTPNDVHGIAAAHRQWGKGVHAAGLNFGDCFAYALAKQEDCPLLFVGNDFAQTDIRSALPI